MDSWKPPLDKEIQAILHTQNLTVHTYHKGLPKKDNSLASTQVF